jgi:hypothetical protein
MESTDEGDITQASRGSRAGLGIAVTSDESLKARRVTIQPIQRASISTFPDRTEKDTPGSGDPLISPPSTGGFSGSTRFDSPDVDTAYGGAKHFGKQSVSSLHSSIHPSLYARSETGLLSMRSRHDDWDPNENCRSHKQVKQRMGTFISNMIIVLALFSTIFSAIFMIIALRGPRWGPKISTDGALTAASAAFLTTFIAKLIELAFVTVVVAFLGQALARRAFQQEIARGVSDFQLG